MAKIMASKPKDEGSIPSRHAKFINMKTQKAMCILTGCLPERKKDVKDTVKNSTKSSGFSYSLIDTKYLTFKELK